MDFNVHFGQKPVIEYIDQMYHSLRLPISVPARITLISIGNELEGLIEEYKQHMPLYIKLGAHRARWITPTELLNCVNLATIMSSEAYDQIPLGRYKDLLLTSAGVAARLGTKPDLYVYDAPRT